MKKTVLVGFALLIFMMMIMSGASILAARNAEKAVKQTDLIAECTTPGTRCAQFQADSELRRAAQVMCPILITLPPLAEREAKRGEILNQYQTCVTEIFDLLKTNPLPGVGATPTTVKGDK